MCEVKDKVFLYAVFMIISISMVTGCGCGESADSAKPGGGGGRMSGPSLLKKADGTNW